MGFMNDDLTPKRPATATTPFVDFSSLNDGGTTTPVDTPAPQGNSNTISDAVKQQQKETENAFNEGLVNNSGQASGGNAVQNPTPPSGSGAAAQAISAPSPEGGVQGGGAPGGGAQVASFTQQPSAKDATVQQGQGLQIDWSKPYAEIEKNPILQQMKPYDILRDYQKNGQGDYVSFMPWLQSLGDVDKTVAANAAARKKADKQAKWEQWGNLFQHMGNFFGTALGAPEQKIESAKDLTERQRKMREATDALRQKGYDQLMVNIYKDRADKQAQMKAEADAKANDALAQYRGTQKKQIEALTPEKIKTEQARQAASAAAAGLSTAKTKTEDALRDKKGKLINAQTDKAKAGVAVAASTVAKNKAQTKGQNLKNSAAEESDNFERKYVNDPTFKKYVNIYAEHNGLSIGNNKEGRGGTWSNEKNRREATKYAEAMIAKNGTKRTVRPYGGKDGKTSKDKNVDYSKYQRK